MPERDNSPVVHNPANLPNLLSTLKDHPGALFFAGGTYLAVKQWGYNLSFPRHVISLRNLPELNRINRTERYLEIGSCASLNRLLNLGKHLLPKALYSALASIGMPSIRNVATLGGNLGVSDTRLTSFPVLSLLEVQVELKSYNNTRWITLAKLHDPEGGMQNHEVITRIRIPLSPWDIQVYKRLGSPLNSRSESLSFCGIVKTQKGVIADFRYIFGSLGPLILRNTDLEAFLVGRKLNLSKKEIDTALSMHNEELEEKRMLISPYQSLCARNLFHWFISNLED